MTIGSRLFVLGVLAGLVATAAPARAALPAGTMYSAALAREKALRASWEDRAKDADTDATTGTTLKDTRAIVRAYEAVVHRHPTSGYCDNALWQAAGLAADAFERWHQDADRQTAQRLFQFLAQEYPSSPFTTKATARASRLAEPAAVQPKPAKESASRTPAKPSASSGSQETPTDRSLGSDPGERSVGPVSGAPAANKTSAVIRDIRRTVLAEVVRIAIEVDREVAYSSERVENPARLLFDLPGTTTTRSLRDANWNYQDDVVRHIRLGRHPNQTTRVVLDLEGVSHYTVATLYNPYRIQIDCERTAAPSPQASAATTAASSAPAASLTRKAPASASKRASTPSSASRPDTNTSLARRETTRGAGSDGQQADAKTASAPVDSIRPEPKAKSESTAADTRQPPAGAQAARPDATDETDSPRSDTKTSKAAKPEPPAAPLPGDRNRFSMARQLGLGVSRIVIDPGHGGHDPGAEGGEMSESKIVLDIALRLEKLLLKQPGVEVVLTRRTDVFVPLQERTAIANREQADLFLSIHANASRNPTARGIETYYLNFATNPDAEAVAARENSASERTMNSLADIVKAITLNNKLDESKDLAKLVQQAMGRRLRPSNKTLKDLGVKQAPFVVLIGAAMPSVLAEVSFITNKREGQLLRSDAYRQRIAEALSDAVLRYKRALKTTNVIAHQ